jgi:cellulose synthase/poly-beta-1,6-N-acetylglucosamine synthase-like glycosyltransferase
MLEHILQGLMYPFLFVSLYFQMLLFISLLENRKKIALEQHHLIKHYPSVTIAVPCWNEEHTLAKTLDSLLNLTYPKDKLRIIVVDDESTDGTLLIAEEYARKHPEMISVYHQKNGGKHTAVNLALSHMKTELFGCLDADSYVTPKTLSHIIAYFDADPTIMAVTPCIHIRTPRTFIQRLQAIEYLMGVFLRKAYGALDAIQVTPGPFSIFRKEVFEKLGPYRKAYNTEDFEITLRMHKNNMRIANSHKAMVYTAGPDSSRGYFHQRLRWARGFLENALDYREMFFRKKYGNFGMIVLPMGFFFVFYGMYAMFFSLYSLISLAIDTVNRWLVVGIHFSMPSFDWFYFNTTVISFIAMIMFSLFLFLLYIGTVLSDDKQEFYKNFPIFFFLYPFFVPLFISRAIFDTAFGRTPKWVLQDNKTGGEGVVYR